MDLPFTLEQFLGVFAAFNRDTWIASAALWIATAIALVMIVRGDRRSAKIVPLLLAIHWLWSGIAYHVGYFRPINPIALYFGIAFVAEALLLLLWWRRVPGDAFQLRPDRWSQFGVALMGYAILYPALGLALGLRYPAMPMFGVPCPTTLFTIGALVVARTAAPRSLSLIPIAWCVVGGSAAFLFGVTADLMLIPAGVLLLMSTVLPHPRTRAA